MAQADIDDDKLEDLFNQCLDSKNSFYNEINRCYRYDYKDHQPEEPSCITSQLLLNNNLNFELTQKHFDKFITRACFGKTKAYLVNKSPYCEEEQATTILMMFTKFTPNNKQLKTILSCYLKTKKTIKSDSEDSCAEDSYEDKKKPTKKITALFSWLDVLIAKGYVLDDETTKSLVSVGYNITKLYSNKVVTVANIEQMLLNIFPGDLDVIKKLIENNKLQPSEQCLINAISALHEIHYLDIEDVVVDEDKVTKNARMDKRAKAKGYKAKKAVDPIKPQNKDMNSYAFLKFLLDSGAVVTMNVIKILIEKSYSLKLLELFLKYGYKPTKADVMVTIKYNKKIFMLYLIELHVAPDVEILNYYIKLRANDYYADTFKLLVDFGVKSDIIVKYVNGVEADENSLADAYLSYGDYEEEKEELVSEDSGSEDTGMDKKIPFKQQKAQQFIKNMCTVVIHYLLDKNVQPDITTLINLLKKDCSVYLIKSIIKKNVIPDKECLDTILCNHGDTNWIKLVKFILDYKIVPDRNSLLQLLSGKIVSLRKCINEILELLISYGLHINMEDLEKIMSKKLFVPNLERFNINYDEHLYFMCHKNRHFPEEYTKKFATNIDSNILKLRSMCNSYLNAQFFGFMEINNLKLDNYCLENMCLFDHNKPVAYSLMTDSGCVPTMRSVVWFSIKGGVVNKKTKRLLEMLDKSSIDIMCKTFDNVTVEQLKTYSPKN